MKKVLITQSIFLLSLIACNGGGGSSSGGNIPDATSSAITAQFIDSPVKGLNVERSISGNAVTGAEGKFTCKTGETVTFKLRDFEIGSSRCGKAIYLDEVAPPATVDRIAAVLQSLSTTIADSGLIDLSSIPLEHSLAGIDLTDDASLSTSISSVKLSLNSVNFVATVTPSEARAHVNDNLPEADASTRASLDSFISNPPTIRLTKAKTEDPLGFNSYYDFYTAKLVVTKEGNVYKAALDEIAESNTTPITKAECLISGLCELDDWQINGVSRLVNGTTMTFGALSRNTLTVLTSPETDSLGTEWPIGSAKIVQQTLLYGGNLQQRPEYYKFDWGGEVLVAHKSAYFPFVFEDGISIKVKIGANGALTGEAFVTKNYVGKVKSYTSFDDYVFDTNDKETATYTISIHQ